MSDNGVKIHNNLVIGRFWILGIIVAALFVNGCSARKSVPDQERKPVPTTELYNEMWVPLDDAFASFGIFASEGSRSRFIYRNGELVFKPNDQVFDLCGQKVWMGKPCLDHAGKLHVHLRDWETSLQPLLRMPQLYAPERRTVVIDPGHGGRDVGAANSKLKLLEKDLSLDISKRLQKALIERGWDVYLTRDRDMTLDLAPRIARAKAFKPDFFISVHVNSAGTTSASGIETFFVTPVGVPSTLTRNYADQIDFEYPANLFDDSSYHMAWTIQRLLLIETKANDRGVKKARFMGVIRNQECPAILIETGFISNEKEALALADSGYRQKIANGIARAFPVHHSFTRVTQSQERTRISNRRGQ